MISINNVLYSSVLPHRDILNPRLTMAMKTLSKHSCNRRSIRLLTHTSQRDVSTYDYNYVTMVIPPHDALKFPCTVPTYVFF
jgi:hypothetical protein